MIIAGNHHFSIVEQPEFCELVEFLHPSAKHMSRHRLRNLLEELYNECQDDLLPGLGPETKVSIAVDRWKSLNNNHFLLSCATTYPTCGSIKKFFLVLNLSLGHTKGENLAEVVEAILARRNLTHHLHVATSDNARTNDAK